MTSDLRTHVPFFPALKLMERSLMPLRYGREPYWMAPVTPASLDYIAPTWTWYTPHTVPEDAKLHNLDVNGSYLGAMTGAKLAHSQLNHTGPVTELPEKKRVLPGYYRIMTPYWGLSGTLVSPLGDSAELQTKDTVWIAAPTLVLLLELLDEGVLGDLRIIDSYTATATTDFKAWGGRLKTIRLELLAAIDREHPAGAPAGCDCMVCTKYDMFKRGYGAAMSMMLTGAKCRTRRPDWPHTIYAQHAASQWRKAWRYTGTGKPVVAMHGTDELTVLAEDLETVMASHHPFRIDETGRDLGAFKTKALRSLPTDTRSVAPVFLDQDDDVL